MDIEIIDIQKHRRKRLQELVNYSYDGVRKNLCDACGWSEARISQLLSTTYRDGTAFTEKNARKLERDLKLEWGYFDQGASTGATETPYGLIGVTHKIVVIGDDEDHESVVRIRKVKLRLSAGVQGFATELDHSDDGSVLASRAWVDSKGYAIDRLVAIAVKGESMEPTLFEDDVVVVNTADTKPVDGGVFAINYEGQALVKRLARDAGEWWLTSDNLDQRRYHRKVCRGDDCIIVGRVVRKESTKL